MLDAAGVRTLINAVVDPCSAGRGVPTGLDDMGLVLAVRIDSGARRVEVDMRVTGPGCMFAVEFDAQIRARLRQAGAESVAIHWENDEFDWTENDMTPDARERLRLYRNRLTHNPPAGTTEPLQVPLRTSSHHREARA